jgi:hypothetical protein
MLRVPEATQQLYFAIPDKQQIRRPALRVLRFEEVAWTFNDYPFPDCIFPYRRINNRSNLKQTVPFLSLNCQLYAAVFLDKLEVDNGLRVLRPLRNLNVQYRVHKNAQLFPILSQLNPAYTLIS